MILPDIFTLGIDILALITFLWSIWQEHRLRKKVSYSDVLNQNDIDALAEILEKIEGDMKRLRAENTGLKADVWDYVDQVLRPLNQRIATRTTRLKQSELQSNDKKGGIIPIPVRQDGFNQ